MLTQAPKSIEQCRFKVLVFNNNNNSNTGWVNVKTNLILCWRMKKSASSLWLCAQMLVFFGCRPASCKHQECFNEIHKIVWGTTPKHTQFKTWITWSTLNHFQNMHISKHDKRPITPTHILWWALGDRAFQKPRMCVHNATLQPKKTSFGNSF